MAHFNDNGYIEITKELFVEIFNKISSLKRTTLAPETHPKILEQELNELSLEVVKLQKALREKEQKNTLLQDDLRAEINLLKQNDLTNTRILHDMNNLKQENTQLRYYANDQDVKITQLYLKEGQLEEELYAAKEEARQALATKSRTKLEANDALARVQTDLVNVKKTWDNDVDMYSRQIRELTSDKEKLQQGKDTISKDLKQKVAAVESQLASQQKIIQSYISLLQVQTDNVEKMASENARLQEFFKEETELNQSLKEKVQNLSSQSNQQMLTITKLENKYNQCEIELKSFKDRITKQEKKEKELLSLELELEKEKKETETKLAHEKRVAAELSVEKNLLSNKAQHEHELNNKEMILAGKLLGTLSEANIDRVVQEIEKEEEDFLSNARSIMTLHDKFGLFTDELSELASKYENHLNHVLSRFPPLLSIIQRHAQLQKVIDYIFNINNFSLLYMEEAIPLSPAFLVAKTNLEQKWAKKRDTIMGVSWTSPQELKMRTLTLNNRLFIFLGHLLPFPKSNYERTALSNSANASFYISQFYKQEFTEFRDNLKKEWNVKDDDETILLEILSTFVHYFFTGSKFFTRSLMDNITFYFPGLKQVVTNSKNITDVQDFSLISKKFSSPSCVMCLSNSNDMLIDKDTEKIYCSPTCFLQANK